MDTRDTQKRPDVAESILVLLANQFPSPNGDGVFIANEIETLADSFGTILIWSYSPAAEIMALPPNVVYMGDLGYEGAAGRRFRDSASVLRDWGQLLRADMSRDLLASPRQMARTARHALRAATGARTVRRGLAARGLDVSDVYLYGFWGMNAGLPLAVLGAEAKAATVRLHGYDLYEERSGRIPLRSPLFDAVDLILPVSEQGRRYLASRYPDYAEKFHTQRLGTRDRGLGYQVGSAGTARVVSCSSVVSLKRVPLIFETLRLAAEAEPLEWVHFGGGPGFDSLSGMVDSAEHEGLTVRLVGQVPNSEVLDFYASTPVSAFVNLSETEGVPVSVMEAMSFGIPVVSTDVGGVSELVDPAEGAGVLVPANVSASRAAEAVVSVLQNPGNFDARSAWERLSQADILAREFVARLARA